MKFYCSSTDDVLQEVGSTEQGLSTAEAADRLEKNGKNKLAEGKKESLLHRFLKQLAEPMTIILIVAAAISAGLEIYNGVAEGHWEFPADVVIILAVVLINAILGVFQESKAEQAIEALQQIAAATSKVIRDGKQLTVKSEDLVVGDIIVAKFSSGEALYMYTAEDTLVNLSSPNLADDTYPTSVRLMRMMSVGNYYAILRPSLG